MNCHQVASRPHTDGSVVFASWRQCALPSNTPESASAPYRCYPLLNRFSSIGLMTAAHRTMPGYVLSRSLYALKIAPSPPSNTWFLRPTRVSVPNGITIGSAAFAGITVVTGRQTDRQTTLTPSVAIGRIPSAAMRPETKS